LNLARASIEEFYEHALLRRKLFQYGDDLLEAFICVIERAKVSPQGHMYTDPYVFAQLSGGPRGACFAHPDEVCVTDADSLIGRPVWDIFYEAPDYIKVALLDAVYAVVNIGLEVSPDARKRLNGTATAKSRQRAKFIVDLLGLEKGARLCVIGVIEDIVHAALDLGAEVKLFDFFLAGYKFLGQEVGREVDDSLEAADLVLVTGNAIKTRTMDNILRRCAEREIPVTVYAMSGANLAPHYLSVGANTVTCESFPYYWYSGLESVIDVYQRGW
jgi:hypothetical protein